MSHITGHAMEEVRNTFQNNTEKNITGTQIGSKFGQDVNVISPITVALDLTDKVGTFDLYQLNDLEDAAISYFGSASLDNKWLIKRFDDAAGTMRYANESNNALVLTYADAWTNRATLTYVRFNELTNY
jgi:hypothetical protein